MGCDEGKIVAAIDGGFRLVEFEIMSVQDVMEIFKGSGHRVAVIRGRDEAYVVNHRSPDEVREPASMPAKDVRQGCD